MRLAYRAVSVVLAVLVLVQAVVAGQSTFGDWAIEVHGWMGNGSFVLGMALFILAIVGRLGPAVIATAGVLTVAMFAQTGLGYVGRTQLSAAAWHIPLGVTIFGLAIYNLMLVIQRPSQPT